MEYKHLALLEIIEEMRQKLYTVASNKPFIDDEVVAVSQSLDLLLNEYYELTGMKLAA